MTNGLDPTRMSVDERLDEVANILALGLVRLKSRRKEEKQSYFSGLSDNSLDFGPPQSVDAKVVRGPENRDAR